MRKMSDQKMLLPILSVIVLAVMAGEAMLTAALPMMSNEYDVPGVFESWILPMVLLVGAAAAPFIGTAGDQYGRRRLLLICLFIYLMGLICGYMAQNIWTLLFSRAMQGIGLASFPLAYALVRDQLPHREADVGIGLISAMYGGGMFIGVIIGSFLIEAYSWRMTYLALIPVIVILLLCTVLCIHDTRAVSKLTSGIPARLDWIGFFTLLSALFLSLITISLGETGSSGFILRVGFGAGAVLSGILFTRTELRVTRPLVDLHLARMRPVLLLIGVGTLTILAFLMLLQEMPFLIQSGSGLGLSVVSVGLILMPGTLCDMIAGPLTGRLVATRGVRLPCVVGSLLLVGAVLILLSGNLSFLTLVIAWMIFSAGMSTTSTSCMIAIIDYVPSSRTAEATGLMQSVQTIGGMVGPVLTGLVLAGSSVPYLKGGSVWMMPASITFTQVHGIVLLLCIIVLICSFSLKTGVYVSEVPGQAELNRQEVV